MCGVVFSTLRSHDMLSSLVLRSLYNYFSFLIIFLGFYNYVSRYGAPLRILVISNILWIVAACIEVINPDVIKLFSVQRTTIGRGLTSFAPEPTFFAIYLFFSSWLILASNNYILSRTVKIIVSMNIIAIFLLAKSLMGILFLFLAAIAYIIFHVVRVRIKTRFLLHFVVSLLLFILVSLVAYQFVKETRFAAIIVRVAADVKVTEIFFLDASMNARLEHVVFSIHGALSNYLIPSGFDTFADNHEYLTRYYNDYFWWQGPSPKIMSWVGDYLYHLGLFGVGALLIIFTFNGHSHSYQNILERALLFVILVSAVPLAFPLVAMLFVLFIFTGSTDRFRQVSYKQQMSGLRDLDSQQNVNLLPLEVGRK